MTPHEFKLLVAEACTVGRDAIAHETDAAEYCNVLIGRIEYALANGAGSFDKKLADLTREACRHGRHTLEDHRGQKRCVGLIVKIEKALRALGYVPPAEWRWEPHLRFGLCRGSFVERYRAPYEIDPRTEPWPVLQAPYEIDGTDIPVAPAVKTS